MRGQGVVADGRFLTGFRRHVLQNLEGPFHIHRHHHQQKGNARLALLFEMLQFTKGPLLTFAYYVNAIFALITKEFFPNSPHKKLQNAFRWYFFARCRRKRFEK